MNNSTIRRLATVLAVLLAAWGGFALMRRAGEDRPQTLAVPRADTAAVDSVFVRRGTDTMVIVRSPTGWRANGFAASATAMTGLLAGLADTSPSGELVAESAASHARLGVDSAGQEVRIVSRGKTVVDAVIGRVPEDYSGTIMFRERGKDAVYRFRGKFAGGLNRQPDDWRDKRLVALPGDSIGAIDATWGNRRIAVTRAPAGWRLSSGAAADSSSVANYLAAFHDLQASGFATRAQQDSLRFDKPRGTVRVTGRRGARLAAFAMDSIGGGVFIRADTGGVAYRIESWTLNQIAPAESTLRRRK